MCASRCSVNGHCGGKFPLGSCSGPHRMPMVIKGDAGCERIANSMIRLYGHTCSSAVSRMEASCAKSPASSKGWTCAVTASI
jgi:hypothetical protein